MTGRHADGGAALQAAFIPIWLPLAYYRLLHIRRDRAYFYASSSTTVAIAVAFSVSGDGHHALKTLITLYTTSGGVYTLWGTTAYSH